MRYLFVAIVACFGLTGISQAQTFAEAYKAFQSAYADGDMEAAGNHAETAWKLAEKAGKDPETLAILCQNFLDIVAFKDPERAAPAATRAVELAEQGYGIGNLPLEELRVLSAYIEVATAKRAYQARRDLVAAIEAYEAADLPVRLNILRAMMYAASDAFVAEDYEITMDLAGRAANALESTGSPPLDSLATANILRAAAMISDKPRADMSFGTRPAYRMTSTYEKQLKNAVILLNHTGSLFPTQTDIDSFDLLFAKVVAWELVVSSMLASFGVEMEEGYSFEGRQMTERKQPLVDRHGSVQCACECPIDWGERKSPRYPKAAERGGWNGAVFVGFHLSDEGRVIEPRVLAEVPSEMFGPAVLKAMEEWQADVSYLEEYCKRDVTTIVRFHMEAN